MISPKITAAAAILAANIVSPAFAQSSDHTGSQMPYYYDNTGAQLRGSWGPQDTASGAAPVTRRHTLYGDAPERSHRQ
jgi:hypothetical protein